MIGNIILRLHDGFASLAPYATIRVIRRAGHEFLVGEVAGQMTENVLACVLQGNAPFVINALADAILATEKTTMPVALNLMQFTQPLTDEIHLALAESAAQAESLLGVPAASNPPREVKKTGQKRQSFCLALGDSAPADLFRMIGKTVADVQISGRAVGVVVES